MHWRLLDDVNDAEVRRILDMARTRTFDRDEVIFHEGDPADTLHLIERGRVAVPASNRHGQRATLAVLGPGRRSGSWRCSGLPRNGAQPWWRSSRC